MKGSEIRCLKVDAFTSEPFRGNPAAVCLLPQDDGEARDAGWMQRVAEELNTPATAFVRARRDGDAFDLRWFTSETELPLCGHATLASAHALWDTGEAGASGSIAFHTSAGRLDAHRSDGWIELDFPALPTRDAELPAAIAAALGATPAHVCAYSIGSAGKSAYLVELESPRAVRSLTPDAAALRRAGAFVVVTTRATEPEHDFVSRVFAAMVGIDEDPATGSAHCALAPYWSQRLNKRDLRGFQASQREGVVGARVVGDRVRLRGQAATVLRGTLVT